jgi:uncharacterized protein
LSPPLLSDQAPTQFGMQPPFAAVHRWSRSETVVNQAWLETLDPGHLAHAIGPVDQADRPPLRLGRYAERLMLYYLEHGPLFEGLAAHLPIRIASPSDCRTTAGEIDFLLRDHAGRHLHWELAIKLFLCEDPGPFAAAPERFMGPQRQDNLALKLGKLFGQQLRHQPPAPWADIAWAHEAYAVGWMFYPWGSPRAQCAALDHAHEYGWWITPDQVSALPETHYIVLPRLRWMQRAMVQDQDDTHDLQGIREALSQAARSTHPGALLIAGIDPVSRQETSRYFVRLREPAT